MTYTFQDPTRLSVMDDGSGIAIFSRFNGLTAFIRTSPECVSEIYSLILNSIGFDINELTSLLRVENEESERIIRWLVTNKFIHKLDA